jgi:hypothetical protein
MKKLWTLMAAVVMAGALGCGDDANDERIGAECTSTTQCENEELTCLTQFSGGYCGASGCTSNAACPDGSICVAQGGTNYCFLVCDDKEDCNENRSAENESNCSSNITRVEAGTQKACVPPSSGT